ncbi:hypothetical protein MPER_08772 [Moniliophthora perniciosa FA553]|nr:hypothetical protein MPER_08772 [Moniliophthora perniciosa FA553]
MQLLTRSSLASVGKLSVSCKVVSTDASLADGQFAMVDEVAWGVGWGTESDKIPHVTDEELRTQTQTPSRSRSRVAKIHVPETPAWDHEDNRSAGSGDAASRRRRLIIKEYGKEHVETTKKTVLTDILNFACPCVGENIIIIVCIIIRIPILRTTFLSRSPSPSALPKTPVDVISRSPLDDADDLGEGGSTTTRGRTFAKAKAVPMPIPSNSSSGIHTSRRSTTGTDKDPRHRIYTISASPPEDEDEDMFGPESPNWGESSLILEGSLVGSPSSAASSLLPLTTFRHVPPGSIIQSLSDGVEKATLNVVVESWLEEDGGRKARARKLRFEDEMPLKQRSGSHRLGRYSLVVLTGSTNAQ